MATEGPPYQNSHLTAVSIFLPFFGENRKYGLRSATIDVVPKEYKEEAQCAQKGGRMLFFVICGFIENFFLIFISYCKFIMSKACMLHLCTLIFH